MKGGLLGQLRVQAMLLNPPYKTPKVTTPYRPPKKLSSRQKREMKIYEIPKEQQVYELYLPLHELWLSYMSDLLQTGPGKKWVTWSHVKTGVWLFTSRPTNPIQS